MEGAWPWVVTALTLNGLAGLAGGLLSEAWLRRHEGVLVAFAAGALLAAGFLDILPEALESGGTGVLPWTFGSFVALAILEASLGGHHAERALPRTLLLSDALHNAWDGASLAAAFLVSRHAGLVATLAIVTHEVPQEVGDYAILRHAGVARGRALAALAGVQLTAVLGAVGVVFAEAAVRATGPSLLAAAAGGFLYIGATDLLPQTTTLPPARRLLAFGAGVALIALGRR